MAREKEKGKGKGRERGFQVRGVVAFWVIMPKG
jgi:hypothetical protein